METCQTAAALCLLFLNNLIPDTKGILCVALLRLLFIKPLDIRCVPREVCSKLLHTVISSGISLTLRSVYVCVSVLYSDGVHCPYSSDGLINRLRYVILGRFVHLHTILTKLRLFTYLLCGAAVFVYIVTSS